MALRRASLFALVTLVGCSSSSEPEAPVPAGTEAPVATTDPARQPLVSNVDLTGTLRDYATQGPLDGAEVCLDGPGGACVTTDADGAFLIQASVTMGQELLLIATKAGHVTTAFPRTFGGEAVFDIGAYQIPSSDVFRSYMSLLSGAPYDAAKGVVMVNVWTAYPGGVGVDGATVAVSAATSRVVYSGAGSIPDASLTSTTMAGRGLASIGGLAPGDTVLTISAPGKSCTPVRGWTAAGNTMRVPVIADAIVAAVAVCD